MAKTWLMGMGYAGKDNIYLCHLPSGDTYTNYATYTEAEAVIPTAGTMRKLRIYQVAASGAAGFTFSLAVNGVASALSVTINNPAVSGSNVVDEVDLSAGDRVCIESARSGSPSANVNFRFLMEFESETAGETIVLMSSGADGRTNTGNFWSPSGAALMRSDTTNSRMYFPWPGTISKLYVSLSAAPGAGTSRTFGLSVEDDTTPDVTVTISNAETSKLDSTNSAAVGQGDYVAIYQTASGSPAGGTVHAGFVYQATGYDLFLIPCCAVTGVVDNANPVYDAISISNQGPGGTETTRQGYGHSDYQICGAFLEVSTAPGASKYLDITLRENEGDPAADLAVRIADDDVNASILELFTPTNDSRLNYRCTPSGTPSVGRLFITYIGRAYSTDPLPSLAADFWPVLVRLL